MKSESREMVWKHQMTGYRNPTQWERECISRYVCRSLKSEGAFVSVWHAFVTVFAVTFVVGTIRSILEGKLVNILLYGVFSVLAVFIVYSFRKGRKKKKVLVQLVQSGKFRVMDCFVYQVDLGGDTVGEGEVQIYNAAGQYCKNKLAVDISSAREWQTNRQLPFLLMRCDYGNNEAYFELFSQRKLGR